MNLTFKQKFNAYLGMSKRNVKIFLKDKTTIFFSLLAQLIILVLYLAFLKQNYVNGLLNNLGGLKEMVSEQDISNLVNGWLLSGLVGSSTITIALNALSVMVNDKERKVDYDYNSSPINGTLIILSYFTGAVITTFILSGLILTLGLIILSIIGNLYLNIMSVISLYLLLLLAIMSSVLLMMIIISFFKKISSLSAFSGVISACIGFFIGAYIPIGQFDKGIQYVANIIPGSHVTCLFRNYLMSGSLNYIDGLINGLDGGAFKESVSNLFSLNLNFFGSSINILTMYLYISLMIIVSLIVNIVLYRYSFKRQ